VNSFHSLGQKLAYIIEHYLCELMLMD
jgi:hypothetical protein